MSTVISSNDVSAEYYAGIRPELRRFIPSQYTKVLEVGCGRGGFRSNLSKEAEVWGIEPSQGAAEAAKAHLDKVFHGTFEDAQRNLPDAMFDLVICNDVIEHMPDDLSFLRTVKSKMRPGGLMFGSIPNMRNWPVLRDLLFKKDFEYRDSGVMDRTHLRFYTIKSFPRLLNDAGYDVQLFEGINQNIRPGRRRPSIWFRNRWLSDTAWSQFVFVAKPR